MDRHKRWFKHSIDFLDSNAMHYVLDYCGYTGTYAYIRLLEIFTNHFDPESPDVFKESRRYIFTNIFPRVHPRTGKKILEKLQDLNLISYKIDRKEIVFDFSEIKEKRYLPGKK